CRMPEKKLSSFAKLFPPFQIDFGNELDLQTRPESFFPFSHSHLFLLPENRENAVFVPPEPLSMPGEPQPFKNITIYLV
ncbi:MAG: hypothetical protein ACOWYE_03475, partial [Desulfatiglandales bacterium]